MQTLVFVGRTQATLAWDSVRGGASWAIDVRIIYVAVLASVGLSMSVAAEPPPNLARATSATATTADIHDVGMNVAIAEIMKNSDIQYRMEPGEGRRRRRRQLHQDQ